MNDVAKYYINKLTANRKALDKKYISCTYTQKRKPTTVGASV